jgi:hypothetical protein
MNYVFMTLNYEFMFIGDHEGYSSDLMRDILTACGARCVMHKEFGSERPHKLFVGDRTYSVSSAMREWLADRASAGHLTVSSDRLVECVATHSLLSLDCISLTNCQTSGVSQRKHC